jgi:AbrB family looped-hinge helix DNA binding protein
MSIIKATEKGQVVIPSKYRKRYGIGKGAKLVLRERDGNLYLTPALKDPVKSARGAFKNGSSALKELMASRREESGK